VHGQENGESKRRGATRSDWRLAHHQGKGWFYTTKAKFPEFLRKELEPQCAECNTRKQTACRSTTAVWAEVAMLAAVTATVAAASGGGEGGRWPPPSSVAPPTPLATSGRPFADASLVDGARAALSQTIPSSTALAPPSSRHPSRRRQRRRLAAALVDGARAALSQTPP